jgi:hypothetical protein
MRTRRPALGAVARGLMTSSSVALTVNEAAAATEGAPITVRATPSDAAATNPPTIQATRSTRNPPWSRGRISSVPPVAPRGSRPPPPHRLVQPMRWETLYRPLALQRSHSSPSVAGTSRRQEPGCIPSTDLARVRFLGHNEGMLASAVADYRSMPATDSDFRALRSSASCGLAGRTRCRGGSPVVAARARSDRASAAQRLDRGAMLGPIAD